MWLTDGAGWNSAKKNLRETFDVLDDLYNISDMESGLVAKTLK
jgi:type II restriction enzyme